MNAEERYQLFHWRAIDITVTAVIAAASGVVFWVVSLTTNPVMKFLDGILPGSSSLVWGLWYLAAPLAAIIVRKPGAALIAEILGAFVEFLMGSEYGLVGTLLAGLFQGLGGELAFLLFAYKFWNFGTVLLSGALSAVGAVLYQFATSLTGINIGSTVFWISIIGNLISGMIFSGVLVYLLYRMIAKTGVLNNFASGRIHQ